MTAIDRIVPTYPPNTYFGKSRLLTRYAHATPKGELVHISTLYQIAVFPGIVHFSRLLRGPFLVLPAAGPAGATWTVRCKRWLRPSSVAHALHGQSHVTQQANQGMGCHPRKLVQGLENLPGSSYVFAAKSLFFPLLAATATTHNSSAARIRAARAHARAVRRSKTAAAAAGVRVLLEASVARVSWVLLLLLLLLLLSVRDCLSKPCLCLSRAGCD